MEYFLSLWLVRNAGGEMMILVSACLLGLNTRYDGGNNAKELLLQYEHLGKFIPICPEVIGGLPTPRQPAEIVNGDGATVLAEQAKVVDSSGKDVTKEFLAGAKDTAKLLSTNSIKAAILKERSPSCGVHQIYDGLFSKNKKAGQGVTAALLRQLNLPIYSEEELTEELLQQLCF